MLVNRHFYRSRYDYREEWLKFSESLSLKLDIHKLALTTLNRLRDVLGVNVASLWLWDEDTKKLRLLGASSLEDDSYLNVDQKFQGILMEKRAPFSTDISWAQDFFIENSKVLERHEPALLVPLISGKELAGMILLGKKTMGKGFLGEDIDLLRSAAVQIAGTIVNARLSEELIRVKELEVFHRFSSFVLHDLKNLVSSLSLVVQNAGEHMSNPEFQKDALKAVQKSVEKMEALIARLSNSAALEKGKFVKADLNQLVSEVVSRVGQNDTKNKTVRVDFENIPKVFFDPEQMEKVVVNLLLNAFEAMDDGGTVKVETKVHDGRVILSVSDNGPGMPPEFVGNNLFRPFQSTKKKGLGIGLYQCKSIVEAHQGKIEVETEEGDGSTFRIVLPAAKTTTERPP